MSTTTYLHLSSLSGSTMDAFREQQRAMTEWYKARPHVGIVCSAKHSGLDKSAFSSFKSGARPDQPGDLQEIIWNKFLDLVRLEEDVGNPERQKILCNRYKERVESEEEDEEEEETDLETMRRHQATIKKWFEDRPMISQAAASTWLGLDAWELSKFKNGQHPKHPNDHAWWIWEQFKKLKALEGNPNEIVSWEALHTARLGGRSLRKRTANKVYVEVEEEEEEEEAVEEPSSRAELFLRRKSMKEWFADHLYISPGAASKWCGWKKWTFTRFKNGYDPKAPGARAEEVWQGFLKVKALENNPAEKKAWESLFTSRSNVLKPARTRQQVMEDPGTETESESEQEPVVRPLHKKHKPTAPPPTTVLSLLEMINGVIQHGGVSRMDVQQSDDGKPVAAIYFK